MKFKLPTPSSALRCKSIRLKKISSLLFMLLLFSGGVVGQVANYSFSSSSGTYTGITGGTLLASTTTATTLDSEVYSAQSIGFNFVYNNITYSTFGLNVNGWISMGSTTPTSSSTSISTTTTPTPNVISAISGDLYGRQFITASTTPGSPTITMTAGSLLGVAIGDAVTGTGIATGSTVVSKTASTVTLSANASTSGTGRNIRFHNGNVRFETVGTAPNRILVVQFSNFSRYTTGAPSDFMNFQIRLYETLNTIDFVYNIPYINTSATREVGLKGAASSDYNNRSTSTNWSATTAGTSNSSSCSISNTVAPAIGLTYTYTPPTPCAAPTSLAASATSSAQTVSSISGSFTAAASSAPTGYIAVRSNSATAPTTLALATALPAVGNTTAFGAGTYVEYVNTSAGSWTSTGLSGGTTYYYYVFSYTSTACSGGPAYSASATSLTQSTVACPATSLAGLSYLATPVSYCLSAAITPNTATLATTAGTVTYSVAPALPSGLFINGTTGAITGTPTVAVAAANYTVTANNACTSTTATINIATLALPNVPTANAATNRSLTSFTANWAIASGATAYILDVSTSSTFASFVAGFNGLNVANVLNYAVTGLSSGTTYYYRVRAFNGSCTSSNSSTITIVTPTINGGVLQETFPTANSGAVPTGWSTSGWSIGASATSGYPGNLANAIYKNLYSSPSTGTFTTATVGPLVANAIFTYDYALYNWNTTSPTPAGWGNFQVQISTDFGTTWSNLGAAVTANTPSGYVNTSLSLSAYAGQYVQFKINATRTTGDFYLSFDNFNAIGPCATPTAPTALVQGTTGPASIAESFTPNGTAPDGYMVVRYPTGSAVTAPTNGTTSYTENQALGLGTISNLVSGASTSFTISGLSPNTAYDIYVYPYTGINCTGAAVFGIALSGTQSTSTCPTIPSAISVGATGDYASLSAVSLILNGCAIANPVLVELQSDYNAANETLPIVFNNNSGSSASNTVTIRPATGAGPFAISGSSTSALLDLNGVDYFTFDGRAGGTGVSVLGVTNTGNGAALRMINDAQNNTVQYLALKASNTSATNGVVRITGAAGATLANGNNNNTITNNAIDGNGVSPNGIYASGSAVPADNKSNVISNNTIFNYYSDVASVRNAGVQISGGNGASTGGFWTISGNSFYQTATRNYANATNFNAVNADGADGVFTISNNFVGGTQASLGGTALTLSGTAAYNFSAFRLFPAATETTTVSGNTVSNISLTGNASNTLSNGFGVNSGQVNITNNTVSSIAVSAATSGGFTGINLLAGTSATATNFNVTGNTISGIALSGTNTSSTVGINSSSATTVSGTIAISNNTIGTVSAPISNSTAGNITGINQINSRGATLTGNTISYLTSTATGTSVQLVGIATTSGSNIIGGSGANGNTIANFTSSAANTGTTTSAAIIGISQSATTAGQVVKNNKVSLLSNTGTATATVNGIYFSGPTTGTNEVNGNLVHTLFSNTAVSNVNGIQIADSGNATVYNNIVRLGLDAAGADVTNDIVINGINQSSVTSNHNIYFNTVYIAGANVGAGSRNTFAVNSAATSGTRAIRNNIMANLRTNGINTGKHYSIKVTGLTGLTINNNDYWTGSTSALLTVFNTTDATTFSAFQTATAQDSGSVSVDPGFIAANASAASFNLGIAGGVSSALESGAATIAGITTDYDGQARPGPVGSTNGGATAPDMGADEFDGIPGYTCATLTGLTAVTTNATVCSNTAILSVSGVINGTGITYQWQMASTQLGTYSNIAAATSSTYTVPATILSNNWYQCIVTCINGPVSATATAVNVVVQACNYAVTRNTSVTYNSIMATGSTYSTLSSADDGYTNAIALTGTTFKYKGLAVTQFYATSNGTMSFNGTLNTHTVYGDLTTATAGKNLMLAPYWTDFVIKGNATANRDASMRYKINGTLGSGTADIIIEWAEMEGYTFTNPNMNFQVVLHENGNTIEYNYGSMLKFDGAANFTGTFATVCAIGLNGTTPATDDFSQRLILQNANSTNFGTTSTTNLLQTPECNSQLVFTPAAAYSGGVAPATVPVNDELAGAINLTVYNAPCISNCGNSYYSSGATASAGTVICSATAPGTADDDVWFTFTPSTTTPNHKIVLTPTFGYDAVLQLIDVTTNTVVQCINNVGIGLSETISDVTLDQTRQYAIRVYDAGTGAAGGGEFSICVSEIIAAPSNDEPGGATVLTIGTTCIGTPSEYPATLAATATVGITICSATTAGTPDDDVWYKFSTGNTTGLTYTVTATGASTYNAVLQLFSGTPGALVSVTCANATNNGSAETITSSTLAANTTYYLRVYHSGAGNATGSFNICVYVTPPACIASPSVPTNNSSVCASASGTTLSWASASNATQYDVYFDNTGGSSTIAVSSDQTALFYTTPAALAVGTYTWRVVPKNEFGQASSCTNFTFTVLPTNIIGAASSTPTLCVNTPLTNITHATTSATGIGTATSLPAGVSVAWASNTITISGTPTASGSFNYSIPLTGGCGSVNATGTITVSPLPTVLVLTGNSACAGTNGTITSSSSEIGINYQLYDATNATLGLPESGTGSGLSWFSIAIGSGYYAIATNATTSCVSANSSAVNVGTITDKTWLGTTDNSWNTASNWSCGILPSSSDVIVISSGSPALDTDFTIGGLGSLTISWTGTLVINSAKTLTIAGTANFGGKSVTIKSDATGTGAIGQLTGTLSGATNVTVERYIPAKRAWRALTTPLKGSDASILSQWQNNGAVISNTGVELWSPTGTGNAGNGLAVGNSNSMLRYDNSTTGAWTAVTNSITTNLFSIAGNSAYMVFPTGAFGSGLISNTATPIATTLKATGQLITGDVTYTIPSASHTLVGNPYASAISPLALLTANITFDNNLRIWDPNVAGDLNVGAYNLFTKTGVSTGTYTNTTGSSYASNPIPDIQSGQAFFVKALLGPSTLTISESFKTGVVSSNAIFRDAAPAEVLRLGLYKQESSSWSGRDGAIALFFSDAQANQLPNKMSNGSENVAYTRNGLLFASAHNLPLVASDVLNIRVWNTTAGANYKLKINTEQFTTTNLNATLEDLFTNSRTPLTLDGSAIEYPFSVTTVAASTGNRFRIVFETNALGINNPKVGGISIVPNPVISDTFQVNLGNLGMGMYSYSICNALGQEVEKGVIDNVTQNTSYSVKFKNSTATGIYIMKVTGTDNSVFTAKLIKK